MKVQLLKAAAFALLQSALVRAHEVADVGALRGVAVGAARVSVAEYEDIAIDEDRRNNGDQRASRGNRRDGRREYRGTAGVPGRQNRDQPYWSGNDDDRQPQPRRRSAGRSTARRRCNGRNCDEIDGDYPVSADAEDIDIDEDRNGNRRAARGSARRSNGRTNDRINRRRDYTSSWDDDRPRDGRREYRGTAGVPGRQNRDQPYWPGNNDDRHYRDDDNIPPRGRDKSRRAGRTAGRRSARRRCYGRNCDDGEEGIDNSADFDAGKTKTEPEAKPEAKPDAKSEAKPDAEPEAKPNAKPKTTPSEKSSNKSEKASSMKSLRTTVAVE